jgi:hypothetical protein
LDDLMNSRGWLFGLWALMLVLPGGLLLAPLWFWRRRRALEAQRVPVRISCSDGRR